MGAHFSRSPSSTPGGLSFNGSLPGSASTGPTLRGRSFRTAHRLDARVLVGLGAAALSLALLAFGLRQVLPESQSVLEATRDLEPGTVVQAGDVTSVEVRLPSSVSRATFAADAANQVIGKRLGTRVAAGQLLAPAQLETSHTSVASGRVQVTIPVDPYTASAGVIGAGDTVVVYSTPRQSAGDGSAPLASLVLDQARVVGVGRGQQGLSVNSGGGPIGSLSSSNQPVWITLDLTVDEGASVVAASRLESLDVALKATSSATVQP